MQAKNGSVIATVIICAVLLAGFVYLMIPEVPEVVIPAIPTAAEIAALISIPAAPVVDMSGLDEIWEGVYSTEIDKLEIKALTAYDNEYTKKDLKDFLEDEIENYDKFVSVSLDTDETEITIVNLGLDDKEDKKVIVEKKYNVKYELDDSEEVVKDVVTVTAIVTYDNGFEADLIYSL